MPWLGTPVTVTGYDADYVYIQQGPTNMPVLWHELSDRMQNGTGEVLKQNIAISLAINNVNINDRLAAIASIESKQYQTYQP